MQSLERRILASLHREAVGHLPNFIGVIIIDNAPRAESQIVSSRYEPPIQHGEVACKFRETEALPGLHLFARTNGVFFLGFAQQSELPAAAIKLKVQNPAPTRFVLLLKIWRIARYLGEALGMQVEELGAIEQPYARRGWLLLRNLHRVQ